MASLQDQLLKAGLANKSQANKAKADKRKAKKNSKKAVVQNDEATDVKQQKAERDRELNKARDAEKARKAARSEAKQLVERHKETVKESDDNVAYNFVHHNKVKTIWVNALQFTQLSKLILSIVCMDEKYYLVPADIAKRISERCPDWIIEIKKEEKPDEDDPYAEYQIPDDLMW